MGVGVGVTVLRDERERRGGDLLLFLKGAGEGKPGVFSFEFFFFEFPLVELALGERIEIAQWRTRHAMHGL